jgi:AAA family ATP:ADP antiporter
MSSGWNGLSPLERRKAGLLGVWFFTSITTLWLLKPIRNAALIAHLGAAELPYVRFGTLVAVGLVVMAYSRAVNHFSRLDVVRGASAVFAAVLFCFWLALHVGGEALGAQRWFVWAVFILVDIYSTVMVAMFWTYTNDIVSRSEADRLYGLIGMGGILGGIAGGVVVDSLVDTIGPVDLLLVCLGLVLLGAGVAWRTERVLTPPPRALVKTKAATADALAGAREVLRNRYLLWIVSIVVAYEFAAATTDFVINVVFERSFQDEVELARMYGRLGWIVSGTALFCQLVLVPRLLPLKRLALLVPPVAMAVATLGLALLPVVSLAVVAAASDRGLNYSLQQVTKESLYVPLSDMQKYKAKAFIDVFVDRAAKALSSVALLAIIGWSGISVPMCLGVALAALGVWIVAASALGRTYAARVEQPPVPEARQELGLGTLLESADPVSK